MIELREYAEQGGRGPFATWFRALDVQAAAKITVALSRLEEGNVSNVKGVGAGVSELKVNFGPGYRVYFGRDGQTIVILLGGGTKKRQAQDIDQAQGRWKNYKQRKAKEK